jgi:hypothetical protein
MAFPTFDYARVAEDFGGVIAVAVVGEEASICRPAQRDRPFGDRSEHRGKGAGRAVDDLQYLRRRGLLSERIVTLGFALGKLTLQIGYGLLGIG